MAALLVIGSALGLAAPVQAHDYLASSNPTAGATITEVPARFEVTTTTDLLALPGESRGFVMQVVGSDGLFYGDGCVRVAGPIMTMGPSLGPAGAYRLAWQAISADGHTISGEFAFDWNPAANATISAGSVAAPVCGQSVVATSPQLSSASPAPAPVPTRVTATLSPTANDDSLATAVWIGGSVLAMAAVLVGTLLLLERRKRS